MNTTKGKFYNSSDQNNEYIDMINYTYKFKNNEGEFLDNDVKLNIVPEDHDMYYAYHFEILNQTMREKRLKLIRNSSNNSCLEENLKMIYNELFSVTGYMDRIINKNNKYYKNFEHLAINKNNPWVIEKYKNKSNIMEDEFGVKLKNNKRIELIAKNMLWCNRATKELEIIRKHIVESKCKDKNECHEYGESFEKIVGNLLSDTNFYDGQSLVTQFKNKYSRYIYGDCDKEDIINEDVYKIVENIKDKQNLDITMDDVYKYLSVSNAESTLYQMKNRFIELAIMEIGDLKKSGNMKGIRLCKSCDHNARNETFSAGFQIVIPGYNFPFNVHANDAHLIDYANKYNVDFENGDRHNPNLSVCVYKYNDKQIIQIDKLKRADIENRKIKDCINYASVQCASLQGCER